MENKKSKIKEQRGIEVRPQERTAIIERARKAAVMVMGY
jgi:hypothetical protein